MSTPVSQPVIPPQPNQEVYGVQELALFKSYTRDTYRTAFGVEAPPWDPSRPKKTWFDSSVDGASMVTYRIVGMDQSGHWMLQPLAIATQEAGTVNLPGSVSYPPYVVAPTATTRAGSGINPIYLSLESEARALLATLGGDGLLDEGVTPVFPVVYSPDEPRRLWALLFKGKPVSVGALLLNRNANGVGSPGQWDTSGSEPVWVPAPPASTGLNDVRPPRPMPVRDLLPNEKLQAGLMGVSVVRADLQKQSDEQSGQFTADDRATLQHIYQVVSRLA